MPEKVRLRHEILARKIAGSGLSQNRWAQKMGIGRGHLSLLVHGKRPYPSRETRRKLLNALNMEFHQLFIRVHVEESGSPQRSRWGSFLRSGTPDLAVLKGDSKLGRLFQDIRFATRMISKSPSFTLVAVLALALGIGANTLLFSVLHATLLRELPFPESEKLVMVWEHNLPRDNRENVVAPANYMAWADEATSFEKLAAIFPWEGNLTGEGDPVRARIGLVTTNLMDILQPQPLLGRSIVAQDGLPGAESVVVLSEAFWRGRYGGDESALGRRVEINGQPATIVGVYPDRFDVPPDVDLWTPYVMGERHRQHRGRFLGVLGKLAPGVTLDQAREEMLAIAARLEKEFPDEQAGWSVNLVPFHEQLVGEIRPALLVLLGAVAFVLLIGCANVANLLLARSKARERELAVRTALGAGRGRLISQMLTESLLLAGLGGLAGFGLAVLGIEVLPSILPADIPAFMSISLNVPVLGFTLMVSILTGVLFGMIPAIQVSRRPLQAALTEGARGSMGLSTSRFRNALVVAEVALSVVLLIGAGLLIKSFGRLQSVDPGFDTANILSAQITLPGTYRGIQQAQFFGRLEEALAARPEVESVGSISWLPLGGLGSATSFWLTDRPKPAASELPVADVRVVTDSYFKTVGQEVLSGRTFDGDHAESPTVVVINETMAKQFWDDESPLGRRLIMPWGRDMDAEIIGVVKDAHLTSLDTQARPTLYWNPTQLPNNFMTVMVRSQADSATLAPTIRAAVRAIDPNLPVGQIQPMESVVSESLKSPRFVVLLLSVFAGLAFVLAAVGVYGVVSYSVSQQTQEIGVRKAFGARNGDVVQMVLVRGMAAVGAGLVIGLGLSFWLSQYLASLLFEVSARDLQIFGLVSVVLVIVAAIASLLPAYRATAVDPMVALRCD